MNVVNPRTLEHVINVSFDLADEAATRRAQACVDALDDEFRRHGYLPYRVGVEQMARFLDPADTFWQTVRDLKLALDPNRIIAPGRYNLV